MAASMEHALLRQFRRLHRILGRGTTRSLCSTPNSVGTFQTSTTNPVHKDPLPVFLDKNVQQILGRITGFDFDRIFEPHYSPAAKPRYKLLTDEELEQEQKRAKRKGYQKLQMPPVMTSRQPITDVLSSDPDMEGAITSKIVCTDITFGISDRKRLIVVRELDGTLRSASREERDRINQIYNPQPGRSVFTPKLFEAENLEKLLDGESYLYVLDSACVQFEPDQPDYIRVTQRTYEHICERKQFDMLRSSRHFGPMAFYFAWYKKIEPLLMEMLQQDLLSDAVWLTQLYHIIHQTVEQEASAMSSDIDKLQVIKTFAETIASHTYRSQLELTIQAYEDAQNSHTEKLEMS